MKQLQFDPANLRKTVLDMAYAGSTVHIGCAFSIIEILAVLYRSHLNYERSNPKAKDRDFLVLSKGHGVMAQYACLREIGWLGEADIKNYFGNATKLKGLSDCHVPGLEVTSGSLGHGLSVGVGLAMGAKRLKTSQNVFAIVGDGEMNEGAVWEGLLCAAHFQLDNFIVIVDENRWQAMGTTDEVLALGNLAEKFKSFSFDTVSVNGHDESQLSKALAELKSLRNGRPKAIVARTIKGKGVSFMENDNIWHYTRLTEETYNKAVKELDSK